jgi:hypothetical protein
MYPELRSGWTLMICNVLDFGIFDEKGMKMDQYFASRWRGSF